MKEAESHVPSHITGFFKVHISSNSAFTGSIGAGICLSAGLKTFVKIGGENGRKLFFNDEEVDPEVLSILLRKMEVAEDVSIVAKQYSPLPIGYGYGMSGASVLGLALAINKVLGEPFNRNEVGRIAHEIEVERRTGLGDVIAQMVGGFEIRIKPGAPGIGEVRNLPHPKDLLIITTPIKKINTSEILKETSRINEIGEKCLKEFLRNPTMENFVDLSRSFWEKIEPMDQDFAKIVKIYEGLGVKRFSLKKGIIYGIVSEEDFQMDGEWAVLEKCGIKLIISRISDGGAR